MRTIKVTASSAEIFKYKKIDKLNCLEYEEDFINDETTMHCSDSLKDSDRDAFFTWCDEQDFIAEEVREV